VTTFNYKKWVTDYKQGKPLFEQTTGSLTGSYTGSYSINGCTDPLATNYNPLATVACTPFINGNPGCCNYTGSGTGSSSTGSYTPCNSGSSSPCATNWFGNIASNPSISTWMYTLPYTQNVNPNLCPYLTIFNNLMPQATAIMQNAPNPQYVQGNTLSNWNDIKNAANISGLGQPQKNQFKRKMAKAKYAQCMSDTPNCC
jgi:hypothetical protein